MDSCAFCYSPASSRLPVELLQQIYRFLLPVDFDAARHTCRLWLYASLDKTLLNSKLLQGGWQAGAEQDLEEASIYFDKKDQSARAPPRHEYSTSICQRVSTEWIFSRRLATETRLCPDRRWIWSCDSPTETRPFGRTVAVRAFKPPPAEPSSLKGSSSSVQPSDFTVSGCSKFVLLTQDHVVFIYSLHSLKAEFTPLTSIFCHRRVVKTSMDTRCGQYAVAILLEGRIGICCEVGIGKDRPPTRDRIHSSMGLSDFRNFDVCTTSQPRSLGSSCDQVDFDLSTMTRSRMSPQAIPYQRRGRFDDATSAGSSCLRLTDSNFHNGTGEEFNPPVPNASLHRFSPEGFVDDSGSERPSQKVTAYKVDPVTGSSIPVEFGARKVYKNLCSVQDPPKSVAVCPQRQCVAFGCKTGVELHWTDALRASTLSRWFPLAAPSDFLYFVPPRHLEQATSNTKLRLISSAGGPEEFVDADHYRAVPLSDGHILFTDPERRHLYLGSDKPGGPTKLRREVACLPPSDYRYGKAPDCYAAGSDIRWGVRIVAAYGAKVMLYNLPPDQFERARPTTPGFQVAQSDLAMDVAVDDSRREPRRLEGVAIHIVNEGVVHDIAVDTRQGALRVWLFLGDVEMKEKKTKARTHME